MCVAHLIDISLWLWEMSYIPVVEDKEALWVSDGFDWVNKANTTYLRLHGEMEIPWKSYYLVSIPCQESDINCQRYRYFVKALKFGDPVSLCDAKDNSFSYSRSKMAKNLRKVIPVGSFGHVEMWFVGNIQWNWNKNNRQKDNKMKIMYYQFLGGAYKQECFWSL